MKKSPALRLASNMESKAGYDYQPLIDFIMDRDGIADGFRHGLNDPFLYDQGGRQPVRFYSSVTFEDLNQRFKFEDGVTLKKTAGSQFILEDKTRWLTLRFDTLTTYKNQQEANRKLSNLNTRSSHVAALKLQALKGANPTEPQPEGRIRIAVKPWRSAREAYYPVIEFAIAHGCKIKPITDGPDSYFEHDSGGSYVCLMDGPLNGRKVLEEFKFKPDIFISLNIDNSGFALHDSENSIIIICGPD